MSREQVFLTGHRNPDMDSICSTWSYAKLKNAIDPTRTYIPIRGHMNDITKAQFNRLGIEASVYVQNIRPRVYDIISKPETIMQLNDPIFTLCNFFAESNQPVIPIFDGEKYHTILAVEEITNFFLRTSAHCHPLLDFDIDNFGKLLKGRFVKVGEMKSFRTTIAFGMMGYEKYKDHLRTLDPPPLCILGTQIEHIQYAVETQVPAIILVGFSKNENLTIDLSKYKGTIFISDFDTDKTLQLIKMSTPIRFLIPNDEVPIVRPTDYFDDVKETMSKSQYRALPVINEEGKFLGIVTRNSFITRPKKKVIMMDHNEKNQSVEGIEDAEIIEIIDHHRLAAEKTQTPIFMDVEPLGSTCTIVYLLFRKNDVEIDQKTAMVLLSGLISDTVILKSPTTTQTDREVAVKLTRIAGIKSLTEFGEVMFSGGASITTQDARKLITADFKCFDEYGVKFGIGQCEVTQFQGIDEIKDNWLKVLEQVKMENKLQWAMIVITNIIREDSIMLSTPFPQMEKKLKYESDGTGKYLCPGVLSRKIQILPEIIRVLSNEN